jgi:hypothetical protein
MINDKKFVFGMGYLYLDWKIIFGEYKDLSGLSHKLVLCS